MNMIGVVGAGVMGVDVAATFAFYGYNVILSDINHHVLENVPDVLSRNIKKYKIASPSLKKWDHNKIMSKISLTEKYNGFENAKWVIENITECLDDKHSVYHELAEICNEETLFGANTSCISITSLASNLIDPSKIIGMHFMNPVPLKNSVETVRGFYTSEDTIIATRELLKSIGKHQILVNDSPGFVSNRISHLFMNEAAILVQENVASPKEIDAIFKQGYAHKMGPLETADLIGLDTVAHSLDILYNSLGEQKFKCCTLIRKMVDANLLGVKTGKGFYQY